MERPMNTPTKAASQVPVSTRIADPPAIALAVALNCTSTAVFGAHADGYLVHSNLAGARMLQSEHALRKVQSRLVARRSDEAKALNAVLSRVAESGQSELLRLLNRNGTGRLLITVNPVPGHTMVTLCVADLEPTDA